MRTTTCLRGLAVALSCAGLTLSACGRSESGQVAKPGPLAGLEAELGSLVPMLLEAFAVPGAAVGIIHEGVIVSTTARGTPEGLDAALISTLVSTTKRSAFIGQRVRPAGRRSGLARRPRLPGGPWSRSAGPRPPPAAARTAAST